MAFHLTVTAEHSCQDADVTIACDDLTIITLTAMLVELLRFTVTEWRLARRLDREADRLRLYRLRRYG